MATKTPWWIKYMCGKDASPQTLEAIAKEYWTLYKDMIDKADIKLSKGWRLNRKKALTAWDQAQTTAQPLLDDWVELCQTIKKVIR